MPRHCSHRKLRNGERGAGETGYGTEAACGHFAEYRHSGVSGRHVCAVGDDAEEAQVSTHPKNSRKHIPASMANLARSKRGGVPKDAAVRQARAQKAGKASGQARHAAIRQMLAGVDPGRAWMAGYRRGYACAYRKWKAYAEARIQEAYRRPA